MSRDGAWEPWAAFFLDAMAQAAAETISVVEGLQDVQRRYRERFQTARRSALMLKVIDLAFEQPVMTMATIERALCVSYGGAANNVNALFAADVAEEVPGTYPKLIRFPEVIARLQVEGERGG